jgi:hypothetical protein
MASFLILGAGKFGLLALQRLSAQDPGGRFVVVDHQAAALAEARALGVTKADLVEAEVIPYLAAHVGLGSAPPWEWLIPMVPLHVAYAWLLAGPLAGQGWEPADIPKELEDLAPLAIRGPQGELYLSLARHLCPDDCDEPAICPVTEEERDQPLSGRLAAASRQELPILVVASEQLAPGVGGYPPRKLIELADAVTAAPGPLLVATACRCHGVVHGLQRKGE